MISNEFRNPLVKCPRCGKMLRSRDLAGHIRRMHLDEPQPESDVERKPLSPLIPLHNPHIIDENGFIVIDDVIDAKRAELKNDESQFRAGSPHPIERTNIFDDIKKQTENRPSAGSRLIHPRTFEAVNCPLCQRRFCYDQLYEHISISHKDQNPKLVLAEFNREYDRLVRDSGNHLINKS
jgi:uncharacterized C2H2 Zn-finger protein